MTENENRKQAVSRKPSIAKQGQSSSASPSNPLPKVLRVGIIQSGRIVEERIVRARESITVGPSEKCTFVLPQEDVPSARFVLFETRGNGSPYFLNFQEETSGKLTVEGEVLELSDAVTNGKATRKGKQCQIELKEDARGKVVLGGTTVLFQFVAPPPMQPRPQLPAAVRGTPFQHFELVVVICLFLSLVAHLSLVIYLSVTDFPEKTLAEKYEDLQRLLNVRDATFETDKKKDKADKGEGEEEFDKEEEKEDKQTKKADAKAESTEQGPQKSPEQIAQERADRRAALAEQIAQQGINKILASLGGSGAGAVIDVLSGGDVAADQDDLLDQVRGVGVSGDGDSRLKGPAGGKGGGEAADVSQVRASGGDADVQTAGPGPEKAIRGNVMKKAPTASGGTGMMSSSDVAKVVNQKIGAIKGCYERALKRDPSLTGKITIRFTITGSGRVSTARATENQLNPEVGDCITEAFTRFRFPPPDGGDVTFEYPFLFTPAN